MENGKMKMENGKREEPRKATGLCTFHFTFFTFIFPFYLAFIFFLFQANIPTAINVRMPAPIYLR